MRWSSASATSRASRIPVALDLSPQTKRSGPFCPKSGFVLCYFQKRGIPKACRSSNGSLPPSSCPLLGPGTLLAGLPILSFLEHILTNVPLLYKGLEKCYFNKLVLGGRGREGTAEIRSRSITMLILILDVKLQMLIINKIYIQS